MRKWELHFATYFSAKQTAENGKEVLRLTICGFFGRNKQALRLHHQDGGGGSEIGNEVAMGGAGCGGVGENC